MSPEQQRAAELDYQAAQGELQEAVKQLAALSGCPAPIAMPVAEEMKANLSSAYCSFCGKSQAEVRKLVAGPAVFICDECVQIANQMLAD